jgi:hypothetical protein
MVTPPPVSAPGARQHELDEAEEDRLDLEDGLAALREARESGEPSVSLEDVKKRLGMP